MQRKCSLVLSSAGFVLAAAAINRLTFILAPVALALIFFYSVTKRFTSATHFFLGLALAIAPIGAWIAQTGRIELAPVVLAAGVICWVAGFDLIYATQDHDFDRREGIRSLVVKLGIARSLRLAQLLHLLTFAALISFGLAAKLGALYYWSMPLIAAALFYEHKTEKLDLAGINRAFFRSNAFVSAVFSSRFAWIGCSEMTKDECQMTKVRASLLWHSGFVLLSSFVILVLGSDFEIRISDLTLHCI